MKTIYLLMLPIQLTGCSNGYADGRYCAEIDVHSFRTDKDSYYTLPIEVKDNKVVKIFWSNGGWLDETHFDTEEATLDFSDKTALFEDDRERMFLVKIINDENCN